MKKLLLILLGLSGIFGISAATAVPQGDQTAFPEKTIGIILPLDHAALREIIAGFEGAVTENYPGKVKFDVENAQYDLNVQRAIIQKFINQKVDLIVPVATSTAQMAMVMVKDQPMVGLAAMISDSDRNQKGLKNYYTGVRDEIDSAKQLTFIQAILPNIKKITLIYSASDKVISEEKKFVALAKQRGITVQPLMIQNLSDLYATSQQIDKDSQAIFILKDNLVASGVNTLIMSAEKRKIPLITSDEDTVAAGAAVALGVEERQIGVQGGELAARILKGEPVKKMPIEDMKTLEIFVNTKGAANQNMDIEAVKAYAQEKKYIVKLNPIIKP